jgi:cytochrome P450
MTDLYWDPFSPELRDDPYPLWKRLRDEAPLYYNDRHDFWVLTRFHDIEQAHRDVETYSSSHGTTLESMSREPMADTGLIIALDPPRHTILRRLVSRAFTTRRVSMLENRVRAVCAELLDPHIGAGSFDYVQDFSAILPPTIISALLGVPEQDQEKLRHLVDDVFAIDESGIGMTGEVSKNAIMEFFEYLGSQFADRKTHPREDMFTELLQAEITDESGTVRRLTDQELVSFGLLLFAAGSETVARHLGWVASVLPDYPDQRAELAKNFSLIPNAIDEILRLEAPSPVQGRWVTKDVTLHGATIPANSRAVLLTGSAGRDERKYDHPDVLDIHRKVDLHLAFGYGVHFCLGAALARMEGRIGLEETCKRWPKWQVDRDNAVLLYTSTVRGPLKLPVYA